MNISYYYHILDIGILYEKGKKRGKIWRIGERKRFKDELLFWQSLIDFISKEYNGIECSEILFQNLESLCHKYNFPNYERILCLKEELVNCDFTFEINNHEELVIRSLIKQLLSELQKYIENFCGKEMAYRILIIIHNLPKSMHGKSIINKNCSVMSCSDALQSAWEYMNEQMRSDYKKYFAQVV